MTTSPALVALGPDISPGLYLSHYAPLAAGVRNITSVGGLHVASASTRRDVQLLDVLHAAGSSSPSFAAPSSTPPFALPSSPLPARSLRGGCSADRTRVRHRRARRPLARFLAPVLVWVFALVADYDLWWRQAPSAAALTAASTEGLTKPLGFAKGRVPEGFAAYRGHFVCFHVLLGLALLSHIAATVADPGFIPREGGGSGLARTGGGRWCERCQRPKPPRAHHCTRCGACVARMDHHCVYVANCVGAGNHKQMLLLLVYSGACAAHAIFLYTRAFQLRLRRRRGGLGGDAGCGVAGVGDGPLLAWCGAASTAVRLVLPVLACLVLVWLAALLAEQLYGIAVDAGTVDRLQASPSELIVAADRAGVPQAHDAGASSGVLHAPCSPSVPDKNRGIGFGAIRAAATASASAAGEEPAGCVDRPATTTAKMAAVGLSRARNSGVVNDGGNRAPRADLRVARFFREFWRSIREEILGEGPWLEWFVPTPARLSPEARERVYAPRRPDGGL